MQIARNTVVTLSYRLTDADGELLEEAALDTPAHYLHGGYDGIFSVVEDRLDGGAVGLTLEMLLPPEDAFGNFDEAQVRLERLENLPDDIEVGMQIEAEKETEAGVEVTIYTVTDIAEGTAVLDGNHPLAGQSLRINLRVEGVRAATPDEIVHGHPHGPDGHSCEH